MNRVLLVTAVFPPQLGGPSEKMAKRVKFFSKYGWHTIVLAPAVSTNEKTDDVMLRELQDFEVHRTDYLFQSQWPSLRHDKDRNNAFNESKFAQGLDMAFVPKGYVRWLPYALRAGVKLAQKADVILSMNNPITLHLIGYLLHKRTGKPWVAEIRDPIVEYAYGRRGPERLNYWLERQIVHSADAVIQREDFVPDLISKRYPEMTDKFVVIPFTGFDSDDFVNTNHRQTHSDEKLVISYTGSFYGNTITPIPFLRGLARFFETIPSAKEKMKIVFAGDWDANYDAEIKQLKMADIVEYYGRISRQACLDLWQASHVLLLMLGNEEDNLLRIPSKFWDYLGAKRTILALVSPEGRVAELVRTQNLGYVADTTQPEEIGEVLNTIWQSYANDTLQPSPSTAFVAQSQRACSEELMASVLQKTVSVR